MILSDLLTPEIIDLVKVIVIIISLVQLIAGFILVFQTFKMDRIIKTSNIPLINLIAIIYIAILLVTVILIISA